MTLIEYQPSSDKKFEQYGDLNFYETRDGSISIRSSYFNEVFHSISGAKKESIEKYLRPSEPQRFKKGSTLFILDVCVGMGYNTACLFETMKNKGVNINWWGIELDRRPIEMALTNYSFKSEWSNNVLDILNMIKGSTEWEEGEIKGNMLWGDARQELKNIPNDIYFDLIFHDAFSPQNCPELWSEEFLKRLVKKLSINGRFVTFSRAAAIRKSLRNSGLKIYSILSKDMGPKDWSNGTLAINNFSKVNNQNSNHLWRPLSKQEEEHLNTNASVPYRDPTSKSSSIEILTRRKKEQKESQLIATSLWKKRWEATKGN